MGNNGGVYTWSKTATSNAGADSTVNYAEGQAPSSLNDSARAAMASVAKWRDDISGALITTGSSAAYQVASNQVFDTLADFHGQVIAFTPHITNAAGPVTMTVDGFANLPLRSAPGVELPTGAIIQGTPYAATYNNTDHALYLHGYYGASPILTPLGASFDFWGTAAPNSSFALMYGQAISRTTYTALFAMFGITYGNGDGSTTFNIPDLRGRFVAGKDDMGGTAASRLTSAYFGVSAATLGAAGGSQKHLLTLGELPTGITSANASQSVSIAGNKYIPQSFNPLATIPVPSTGSQYTIYAPSGAGDWAPSPTISGTLSAITATSNNTGGTDHPIVPPAIIANKLLRIL